ncbi:MAG: class II aldolase/adducin family protein [Sphaerochaetaceae bacterium]|nr:class II aldolase/adducin family protein [Sphaerochaetaceae bacterium]
MQHDITELLEVSRRYGSDARYVLLGGGNTSLKIDDVMYVKASGHALANIDASGFVAMSLPRLEAIWNKTYPEDPTQREKEVLADMMASRSDGETARPSVEALLHAIIPFRYVVHLHPAIVNGLTCSQSGKTAAARLFPEALWIPLVNPGYILAKTVRDAQAEYKKKNAKDASLILLQNHGVFVAADTIQEIDQCYKDIMDILQRSIVRKPIFTVVKPNAAHVALVQKAMQTYYGGKQPYPIIANRELSTRLSNLESFASISSSYTPDHIVYSGFAPLWVDKTVFFAKDTVSVLIELFKNFEIEHGVPAKIIAVQETAVFAINEAALLLFLDTVKVAAFTESFGGPRFMDANQINFIRNWEVESYRANMVAK